MSEYMEFGGRRIHFDIDRRLRLMSAHSDPITWDQFEDYKRFFRCGTASPHAGTGDLYWHADPRGTDKNTIRIAEEWVEKYADKLPAKAVNVRWMLERAYENRRHQSTGT